MKLTPFLPLLLSLASLQAATLSVTTMADSGSGSLRTQIAAAASGDTVAIAATGTITLTTGEIAVLSKNLTITGPGANILAITSNGTSRALKITNAQCSISGITFNNCKGLPGDVDTGGAIAVDNFSSGGSTNITTISDCAFTNNQSGWGGALDVFSGGLVLSRCTFSANTCTGLAFSTAGGGGALSIGPSVTSSIVNCTFSSNSQTGSLTGQPGGGAIFNYGSGSTTPPVVNIEHCTFSGNLDSAGAAGAIKGNDTVSYHTWANLKNCLFVNNQAPTSTLRNFAGSTSGAITTAFGSLGGNVTNETLTSTAILSSGSDKVGNSSLTGTVSSALALNGGVTPTLSIVRGSPAQGTAQNSTVITDQRGAPRHAKADAGAFELIEPEIGVTVSSTPVAEKGTLSFGTTPFDTAVTKIITVTNTQTSPYSSGSLSLSNLASLSGYTVSGFPATALGSGQSASFQVTLAATNTGLANATLSFAGNDRYDASLAASGSLNQHTINLSGLVTDTLVHWRQQHFGSNATNAGLAADMASPAGDGLSNLVKYSLGLDPSVAYPPSTVLPVQLDLNGRLSMLVNKNPAAGDVQMAIEVTSDLASAGSWNTNQTTVDQNTTTVLQAHDNVPVSSAMRRFMHLKVTKP